MEPTEKNRISNGRNAIDQYRLTHKMIHESPWNKGMKQAHNEIFSILSKKLEKNGFSDINDLFAKSRLLRIVESGIMEKPPRRHRQDLSVIGVSPVDPIGIKTSYDGVELRLIESASEREAQLIIDGNGVMITNVDEHLSAEKAVTKCPHAARAFIGGLGLGLVLLYLALSGKAREIIVIDIDERVIHLFKEQIMRWFDTNYPDFNLVIEEGDAFKEIGKHGKFDWIYIDLTGFHKREFAKLSRPHLTDNGVFTHYEAFDVEW